MKSSKRIFVALATILVLEASAHDSNQNFQQGSPANNFNKQNENVPVNTFQKFGQGNDQQNGYNHNKAPPQLIQTGHNFNQGPSNINTHNAFNHGPGNIAFNRNQAYQPNSNFGQSFNNGQIRQPFQSVPPFQFQNPQLMPPQFQNVPALRPVNNQNTFSGASSSASSIAAANSAVFQNRPGILNNANRFNMINLPVQTGLPTAQTIKLPIPSNSKYKIVHLGLTQVSDVNDAGSKQLFETNTSHQQNVQPIKNAAASKSENVKENQQFINNLDPNQIENAIKDNKEATLEISNILENDKDKSQAQTVLNTATGQYGTSFTPKDRNSYPISGFLNNQPYYLMSNSNTQDSAPKSEVMQGKEHTNKVEKAMKDIKEAEIELSKILEYERNILNKEKSLAQTVSYKAGSQYRVPSTPSQETDNTPTSSFIGLNKPYMPITSYGNSQASGSSLASDSLQNSFNIQKNNLNYPYNNQYGNPSALQYIPNNLSGTTDILNSGPASNTYPGLNSPASSGSLSFDKENSQSQSFTSSSSNALSFSNKNIGSQYLPNMNNLPPLNRINHQPLYSPLNGPNYGSLYKNIPANSLPPITDFSLNKYEAPKLTSSYENGPTPTSYNSPNYNIFNKPIQPLLSDAKQQSAADQDKTNNFGDFTNSNNIISGNTVTGTSFASATSQTDTTNSKYLSTNYQNYLNSHNIVPETTNYNNNYNFVDNPTLIYKENNGLNNPIKNVPSTNTNDLNNTPVFGNSNNETNEQPYIFLSNEPSNVTSTSSTSSSSSSSSLDASTSSSTYAFNSNPYTTNYAYLPNQPTRPNYGQISSLVQSTYTPLDNKYLLPSNEFPVAGDAVTKVNTVPNYEFNNPINIPPSEGNGDSLAKITYGDVEKLTSIDTSQAESSISQDLYTVNQWNILTDNSPSIIGHKTSPQSDFDGFKYDKNENSAISNSEAVDVTTVSPYGFTEPQTDVITEGSSDIETEYNGYSNVSSSSSSSTSVATSDSETTDAKRTNYQLISSHPRANHKGQFQRRKPFRWQHKKNRFGHGSHSGTEDSLTFSQTNKRDQLIYDTTSPLPIFDDDVSKNPSKDENEGTDNPLPTTTDNDNLLSTDTPASADYSESDISQSEITKNKNKNDNDSLNQHLKDNTEKKYDGSPSESSYTGSDESSASANSQYDSLNSQLNEYTYSKRNKYLYGGRYNPRVHNKHGRRPEFAFHSTDSPAGSYGIPDDLFNIKNNGDESHQSSEADQDSLFYTSPSPYTNDESQTSLPVTETNDSADSYNYYKNSDYSENFESSHVESESETVSEIETINIDIQNGSKMRKQRKQYPGYRHRQLNRWKNNPEYSYAPTTDTPVKITTDNQYSFDHTTVIPFGHPNYEWTVPFNNVPLHNLYNTQSPYVNTDQYNTGRPLLIPYGNTMFDWNNANTETPTYNNPSQTQSPVQNSHGQDNKDQTTESPYFNPNYDWIKVNSDAPSNNYPIQSTSDDIPSTYSPNTEKDKSDINKTSYTSYNHQYAHTSDTTSVLKDITNTNTITNDKKTSTRKLKTESDKKEEIKKTETNHVQHTKGNNEKVNEESSSTDVKEKTEYSSKTKKHKNQVKKSSVTRNTSEFSFDPQTENPYIRGLTIVLKILDSIEKLITGKCENGKA